MRIAFIGHNEFGKVTLEAFLARGDQVAGVFCAPEKPGDKPDAVRVAAQEHGLPLFQFSSLRKEEAEQAMHGLDADIGVMAYVLQFAPQRFVCIPRHGTIQYHPSLLPRHRGIAAIEWTIREGDPIAGGSIYHLADRMDAGAIAAQEWVFVKKGETARELWERALAPLGQKLLGEVIDYAKVHNTLPAKPQDEQFATLAPSLDAKH